MSKPVKQQPLPFPQDEKPEPAPAIIRWRCPNCGQQIFTNPDEKPPDLCAYCRDMTTWQRLSDEKSSNTP